MPPPKAHPCHGALQTPDEKLSTAGDTPTPQYMVGGLEEAHRGILSCDKAGLVQQIFVKRETGRTMAIPILSRHDRVGDIKARIHHKQAVPRASTVGVFRKTSNER